jgi:hypothetical protein
MSTADIPCNLDDKKETDHTTKMDNTEIEKDGKDGGVQQLQVPLEIPLEDPSFLLGKYDAALKMLKRQCVDGMPVKHIRQMFRVMCDHEHDGTTRVDWFVFEAGMTTGEYCFLKVQPLP